MKGRPDVGENFGEIWSLQFCWPHSGLPLYLFKVFALCDPVTFPFTKLEVMFSVFYQIVGQALVKFVASLISSST